LLLFEVKASKLKNHPFSINLTSLMDENSLAYKRNMKTGGFHAVLTGMHFV